MTDEPKSHCLPVSGVGPIAKHIDVDCSNALDPLVTVVRTKRVPGWPKYERGDRAHALPVSTALIRAYTTDAHFTQYATPVGRRLNREAIERLGAVAMHMIVFDIDCPVVHGTPAPAPAQWRDELCAKVEALADVHPDPFMYFTRGGARLIYRQAEPTILRSQADARRWRQEYVTASCYFARRFGIVSDLACDDWTRLFRLPRVVRDGKREAWDTRGDASNIGALMIEATPADVALAASRSRAFKSMRVFGPSTVCDGFGLFFHVLRARGYISRKHDGNAYVVMCPNRAQHSVGADGDGSTLLYLPKHGAELGAIHCLHSHCCGFSARDWLQMFHPSELEAARRVAGIIRRVA